MAVVKPTGDGRNGRRPAISFDAFFTTVIAILLIACPFAFGSVHRWAYTTVEIVIFSLIGLWSIAAIRNTGAVRGKCNYQGTGSLFAAALAFLIVVASQLIPLPPRALKLLSPSTYALYVVSVNGWPSAMSPEPRSSSGQSPSGEKTDPGATKTLAANDTDEAPSSSGQSEADRFDLIAELASWRPVSVAPSLTAYALIEAFTYISFFFLVLTYRFDFGVLGETRFLRFILVTLAVCGSLLAITGIVEQAYWNGKILWFFVPYDWGAPHYGALPRASGPFINPDHFANYLGMIFPLTAGCTLFGLPGSRESRVGDEWLSVRAFFGLASFLILVGITLSVSRAIWLLTLLGIITLGLLGPSTVQKPASKTRTDIKRGRGRVLEHRKLWRIGTSLVVPALLIVLVGAFVGTRHDAAVAERLGGAVSDPDAGIGVRPALWAASIHMFTEYPLEGVGLSAWPEIFPQYELPPRLGMAFHQAHNDYLQLTAEVGVLGLIPFVFALFWLGRARRLIRFVPYDRRPLLLALCIAIAVMLLHELVDFSMHITANALLFTLLLALAIRLVFPIGHSPPRKTPFPRLNVKAQVASVCVVYSVLVCLALGRRNVTYPADVESAANVRQATETILRHPASASAHMGRFRLLGATNWPALDIDDLASAVWLDPTDPYVHDLYASALDERREMRESLHAITMSMFNAPDISSHYYLDPVLLRGLNLRQRDAVEKGLTEAAHAKEPGAISALAWVYSAFGDFDAEARLYERAANDEEQGGQRSRDYDLAGQASLKAGLRQNAIHDFGLAITNDLAGTQAYSDLLATEIAAKATFDSVSTQVNSAANRGANPAALWPVLASAFLNSGDTYSAEQALLNAVNLDPSYGLLVRTGEFYLGRQEYDRAAVMFRRAIETSPDAAAAYYDLGASNEGVYEYFQAEQAYGKAAQLSPADYRPRFEDFKRRMAVAGQLK